MHLSTNNRPLSEIIRENAVFLWGKIIRTPGYLFLWNQVSLRPEWNLKAQRCFIQGVLKLTSDFNFNFDTEQFFLLHNPIESKGFSIRLGPVQEVYKTDATENVP